MTWPNPDAAALLALALACTPRLGVDGPGGEGEPEAPRIPTNEAASRPDLAKLSSHLLEARRLAAAGRSAAEIQAEVSLPRLRETGDALVEIALRQLTPEILDRLRQAGLEDSSHSRYARAYGWIGLDRLDEVAALAEVVTIRTHSRAGTRKALLRPVPEPATPPSDSGA